MYFLRLVRLAVKLKRIECSKQEVNAQKIARSVGFLTY